MKKKILLLLLLITLFTITNVKAATKNIEITNVSVIDKSGTITVVDPVFSSNEITSNITFNQKDDFVTFELTLKNNENDKYKIDSINDNNLNNNIKIEYDYSKNYISKGETSKIKVKLTYKKQLLNVDKISLNDLQIFINLINEEGKSSQIVINPTTSDNILHYLVLLIITLTGLVFIQKKKKNFGRALLILPILLLPFAILAKESYKINIRFIDIDVVGVFEDYNIIINPDNGEAIDTRTITYGQKIGTLPSNPEKDGYTFEKWVDNKGREVTSETVITGPITIKAKYNVIEYNITYDYDGGSANNPSKYTIEDEITLNNPTRNGYAFAGWTGTGISTPVSTVTIPVGSKGARTYTAHWTQGQDTPYRVIHKYQNLDLTTYTDVVRNLTGPTGDTITVAFESKYGFDDPASAQNVTIDPDNLQVVTYYYTRTNFNFSISDRTYVDSSSTADNSYPYETDIHVKAIERPGYSFAWSDGNTNYERTFKLEENKTIYPVYTANTNTPYIVKHYKMNLDGTHYTIAATQNLTGTTGAEITPLTNTYDGFTAPSTETTTISGNGDTIVEYYYTRNQQHVTINTPEYVTEGDISGNYYYEEEINLTAKTREGYLFSKWSNNDTSNPITLTIGTSDITIGPIYSANKYTVHFDKNDELATGTMPDQEFEYNTPENIDANLFVKTGYTFAGWNTKADGTGLPYIDGAEVTNLATSGTVNLYAEWTPNTNTAYKVIHKKQKVTLDGYDEIVENLTGTSDSTVTPTVNVYTGFTTPTAQTVTISRLGDTVVTYVYDRKMYTVTFNTAGGSTVQDQEVAYGAKATRPATDPTKTGYTFDNWYADSNYQTLFDFDEPITASVPVYGNFEINSYTVTFDTDGGSSVPAEVVTYGGHVTRPTPDPTKTGYNFINWYEDSSYQTPYDFTNKTITDTTTIYGKFEVQKFTVTFDTDGGTTIPSQIIDYNGYVTRPATDPTKQGKVFVNWYEDSSYNTVFDFTNTKITSTTTIFAKFANESITVTFDTDGGSTVSPIVLGDGEFISELPTTTKADYYFLGWYENLSDANPVSEPYMPTEDIELKAKWQKLVCKKATTLNETECHSQSGRGCRLAGYADGDIVTFGNVITSDTYVTGDALDCDVDGTGYNKRFYYMRTLDNRAVLISGLTKYAPGDNHETNYKYEPAKDILPTPTEWSNLPVTFENGTKVGRFPTREDTEAAIGSSNIEASNSIKNLEFIFEDIGKYDTTSSTARSTVWVEEVDEDNRYRYHINTNNVVKITATSSTPIADSKNCVKPVIEVPLYLIEDSYIIKYDPYGGTVSPEYAKVKKGDALGTIPTPTKTDYVFDKWYTSLGYTTSVNENTIPQSYATYYAKWLTDISNASFEHDSFVISVGDEDDIVIDTPDTEEVTYTSNNPSIITVDSTGHITGLNDGIATITVTGVKSGHTRTINVTVTEEVTDFTVTFDSQGGTTVNDMHVPKNTALGSFPTPPTKSGEDFAGWYTNTNYSVEVTVDTVIKSNVTFYAKWIPSDAIAAIGFTYFNSLQAAFDSDMTGKTTITLLKDINPLSSTIDLETKNTSKDIVFDLNGHTITSTKQVMKTKATIEIKNGSIINSASDTKGTIDVKGGKFIMNSGSITATGSRQALYNDGGIIEIGGTTHLIAKADGSNTQHRATVHNVTGTLTITGGTIESDRSSNAYAVSVNAGTFTLGLQDGQYDNSNPELISNNYGIYSDVNYSVYDGIIKGKTASANDETKITGIETGSIKVNDDDGTYKILYYNIPVNKYKVTFNAHGGIVDPEYINVDEGNQVGTLPTPSRGTYTFDGWYTEETGGIEITSSYTPTNNVTIHAHWSFNASTEVINFNMNNDALDTYFSSISSWKDLSQSAFQANMRSNFDANSCSECNGVNSCTTPSQGTKCEQSIGYNTGVNDSVFVYESDEINKNKGSLVTYTSSDDGNIYNMIPGETYYWESATDSNVHGLVKASGNRRTINSSVRNVRDLGGLPVSYTANNVTKTGTIKYGKLFRGAALSSSQSDVTSLAKLGVDYELDLRPNSDGSGQAKFTNHDNDIIITNYLIYPDTYESNYTALKNALKDTMNYVIAHKNDDKGLYFHCTIGTDRTGTLAYFLEGFLGVSEEDRVEDYELSYYYGMTNRDRYHDNLSISDINPRFTSMHNTYDTNDKIVNWFTYKDTTQTEIDADLQLIQDFRDAIINYN